MSGFIDLRLEPGLWLGVDWSLRWALLIAVLAAWFALHTPRSAAVRLVVCQLALVAGLALPLVPHLWKGRLLPARRSADAMQSVLGLSPADSREESLERADSRPAVAKAATPPRPLVSLPHVGQQAETPLPSVLPSRPFVRTPEPLGLRRITVLVAAGLWAVGVGTQLLRLLAAFIWLKLLCRKAGLPSRGSQELFERCRQEMRVRRSVRLGLLAGVSTPLVVGGWRSSALVPADWDALDPEAQRAVLCHELAHLARFDDLAKVAEELVRALFFFHPLVHWLLNRIDGYREEVCDTAVLRQGIAGPTLAEILVDFSRRHAAARRDVLVRPALPFFHRRSVKRRIAELLEDETVVRWSTPLAGRQIASLGLLAAVAIAGLGSFGLEAADSPASGPAPPVRSLETGTAGSRSTESKTAAESSTLKRILANWQARQSRTRSLHLAWDSQIPPNGEPTEIRQLNRALLSQKVAEAEVRGLTRAVEPHVPVRRGDGPGAPKDIVPKEELAKAQARLKTAQADLELAKKNAAHPNVHFPFRVLHNELWIEGDKRIRIEQSFTRGRGYRCVRDGTTSSMFAWRSETAKRPLAKIWSGGARTDLDVFDLELGIGPDLQGLCLQDLVPGAATPRIRTPWMIFRPFGFEGWRPKDFRLIAEDAVVGNAHYVKIARMHPNKSVHETTYFVDPARDDVIVSAGDFWAEAVFRNEPPIDKTQMFALAIEYQRDRDWGWVPVRWKVNSPANVASQAVNTVTGLTINETFPAETFAMNFPPGTAVIDRRTREQYVIADNGSKTSVSTLDSDKSLRIYEALESRTDFTIDPQTLKDALRFIHSRYRIAILIDDKAFEERKIASTIEVTCNQSGIKLRELLTKLLGQVDKSVGFKIQNGILVIEPHLDWIDFDPTKPLPEPNKSGAK
jgi:beta-lactamase regulating signal transducer with metallopeptidase domain